MVCHILIDKPNQVYKHNHQYMVSSKIHNKNSSTFQALFKAISLNYKHSEKQPADKMCKILSNTANNFVQTITLHLFHYVPIIVSSWNFQELLLMTEVMSMQKVKVGGQRSRSQRSKPNLAVSGP